MPLGIYSERGPASYATGGFTVTLGDIEYIAPGSGAIGRKVLVDIVSSSRLVANIASHSGNILTVLLRDGRSNFLEYANTGGDALAMDFNYLYVGF